MNTYCNDELCEKNDDDTGLVIPNREIEIRETQHTLFGGVTFHIYIAGIRLGVQVS